MSATTPPRRWPAFAMATLFLGYAGGKAAFAIQNRLGFPGGPPVSPAETESYFLDPATAQWFATASGLLGAGLALATVTALGRRLPRTFMLLVLGGTLLAAGGGAGIVIADGFFGLGVGWRWHHGVIGIVVVWLLMEMTRSYAKATRRAPR